MGDLMFTPSCLLYSPGTPYKWVLNLFYFPALQAFMLVYFTL